MADLMKMIQNAVTDQVMDSLADQIGGGDRSKTKAATNGALSTILAGLAKNAIQQKGADALSSALDRDHDGSILDDLGGFLSGSSKPVNEKAANGAGILKHILGGKEEGAADVISKMSGVDKSSATDILMKMAPVVMGALGKAKRENNMNPTDITDVLSRTVKSEAQDRAEMSLIEKFIDQDGDGSIMDDLAKHGTSILGSFFKKR